MEIRWITAFIDQSAEAFETGTRFWQGVTNSGLSPRRGPDREFATLLPPTGDPYIRVQRTGDGSSGIHLDFHVSSLRDARRHLEELGATLLHDLGHLVMTSPAGMVFCLVEHHGESVVTSPFDVERPHVLDQVCIDIPASQFEEESIFWTKATGWEQRTGALEEFAYLVRSPVMPVRILFQRLGADDERASAHAHLDLACGDHVDAIAEKHQRLGAVLVEPHQYWTAMKDPAGMPYCLTRRDPATGALPG